MKYQSRIERNGTPGHRPELEDIEFSRKQESKLAFVLGTVTYLGGVATGLLIAGLAAGGKGRWS